MAVNELLEGFEAALSARTPFVVRGAAADWPARAWALEKIAEMMGSNKPGRYWYDLPHDHPLTEDLALPEWLTAHWDRLETRLSLERPMRLWASKRGDRTPWHYDGNALDVINVQLSGAKHFVLISPDNEIPWIRFLPISTLGYGDTSAPTLQVTLRGGDLIFIPRFWTHHVRALDESNRNINWVWTDSEFSADSAVAAREAERLAAIKMLEEAGRLGKLIAPSEAESLRQELLSYAGAKRDDLIAKMLDAVTPEQVDARVDAEMKNQSPADFIAHLDSRGQKLLGQELYGQA